jgi:uncharacterized membrane protein YkvA (DUF1232 family)
VIAYSETLSEEVESLTSREQKKAGSWWAAWKRRARQLKLETWAVYLAVRDPRTPWYARLVAVCVVGYALSPIDLVPDFIPVLGYLDDLILVPLGLALALRLIPQPVLEECRERARLEAGRPGNWRAGLVVVFTWLGLAALAVFLVVRAVRP